jgi:hypothetical protein
MIKGLISAVIIIAVLYGAWELWLYWDQVSHDRDLAVQKEADANHISEDQLPGMPKQMAASYKAAKEAGPAAVERWLKTYKEMVADPRRAWIELDYMMSISHDRPGDARRIFAEVASRVHEGSPVYNRVKQLEPTYK